MGELGLNLKYSYEDVYGDFKDLGYELLDKEYIKVKHKMTCVDSEGYKFYSSYDSIRRSPNMVKFHKNNPYTIENIHHFIKLNRENVELVSTEYTGTKDNLIFKCLIHNNEFSMTWDNFNRGGVCPICSITKKREYEEVSNLFKNIGYTLLDAEYINGKSNMTAIDENGFKIYLPPNDLVSSKNPRLFTSSNPYVIENIIVFIGLNNRKVRLVSKAPLEDTNELIFKCLSHNVVFKQTFIGFSKGEFGCPMCLLDHKSGKNSPTWKGGITNLSEYLRHRILPWKIDSFEKYDRKCDITGIKADKNVIHHLHSFASIVKETMKTLNLPICQQVNKYTEIELKLVEDLCLELHYKYGLGVCLTKEIHDELHSYYGGGST